MNAKEPAKRRKTPVHGDGGNQPSDTAVEADTQEVAEKTHDNKVTPSPRITTHQLFGALYESLGPSGNDEKHKKRDETVRAYLRQVAESHKVVSTYNVLMLYDHGPMLRADADRIYAAVTSFSAGRPLLLVLYSSGGQIGPAYLIGKLCREHSDGSLVIAVPRQAKSAATLVCCSADQIHMGSLSELGPIDPQIDELPALALKNSVEHIADLVKKYPNSADMFAKYLHYSLKLVNLGYYERVAQSAAQYAERLLSLHASNLVKPPDAIANELVNTYKDHGFVIDKAEAAAIFGSAVVKFNTEEYMFSNDLYQALSLISDFADHFSHHFYMIGSWDSAPVFYKKSSR
ncbi:MAG: hypothetical protein ABFC88_06505 [Thermoguttaceae bacterium]